MVIVQERDGGGGEVAAVDPMVSMTAIENPHLTEIATAVQAKLRDFIAAHRRAQALRDCPPDDAGRPCPPP